MAWTKRPVEVVSFLSSRKSRDAEMQRCRAYGSQSPIDQVAPGSRPGGRDLPEDVTRKPLRPPRNTETRIYAITKGVTVPQELCSRL